MAAHNFSFTIHEGFAPVVARTRKALKDQGFGIISELDLAEMYRATLGRERQPHLIFGVSDCYRDQGSVEVLPCHVVVRSTEAGDVVIDLMDPAVAIDINDGSCVQGLTDELRIRYENLRAAVAAVPALA